MHHLLMALLVAKQNYLKNQTAVKLDMKNTAYLI